LQEAIGNPPFHKGNGSLGLILGVIAARGASHGRERDSDVARYSARRIACPIQVDQQTIVTGSRDT
jgi:hypothetical protein